MMDPEILKWTEKYGSVTTFSFMVYGPIDEKDTILLLKGLDLHFHAEGEHVKIMSFVKGIEEEEAKMMGVYQGINLFVVVPEDKKYLSTLVEQTIKAGLEFLRLKCEFLGTREVMDLV
jgi:hypothetical protein